MTIGIAKRVRTAWRRQAEQHDEPSLELLLSPAGDHRLAARAVRESVMEVMEGYQADEPFFGEWAWLQVSDGVVLQIVECEAFDEILHAVAAALERRGVEGMIDVRDVKAVAAPPVHSHLLGCHLRVRGEREHSEPLAYRWTPHPDAFDALLSGAARWCARLGDRAAYSLRKGTVGPDQIDAEGALQRMRDAVAEGVDPVVTAMASQGYRGVGTHASFGRVSLVIGGDQVEQRWEPLVAELIDFLREHAALLAYGHVRRGWSTTSLVDAASDDWPRRPRHAPRGAGWTGQAFEDVFAPDVFGVQLLGPGYVGRLPDSGSWRREELPGEATLLEHGDLHAWFDEPFVPFATYVPPDERALPNVLVDGRRELKDILYAPGALHRAGHAEEDSL